MSDESEFENVVRTWFSRWWGTKLDLVRVSATSESKTPELGLRADGAGPQGSEQETLRQGELYGLAYSPPKESLVMRLVRFAGNGFAFPVNTARWRPDGLKVGDVVLYCNKAGTEIRLRGDKDAATAGQIEIVQASGAKVVINKDGKINVDAAPGQDVAVNQGTLNVARKTDQVQVTIPVGTVVVGGVGTVLNVNPIVVNGSITGPGALHFKG